MTEKRARVLVKFPPDVLADLDAEAKRTGKSRIEVIVSRCRRPVLAGVANPVREAATNGLQRIVDQDRIDADRIRAGGTTKVGGYDVALGPVPPRPGSRLKQEKGKGR